MNETWQRLKRWLEQNAPALLATMQPGATDAEIIELENHLGTRLPADYRAFLALSNGQLENAEFGFADGELLSAESVNAQWMIWKELLDNGTFKDSISDPQAGIRNDWWNPRWIPFTHDGGGNHLCLDLDPANGGTIGQVITMEHDNGERVLMFDSFSEWLEQLVNDLESGQIVFDTEEYNSLVHVDDLS
jgi:cell wall assembly regulator SMI1